MGIPISLSVFTAPKSVSKNIRIAVIGNPNSGKSQLINSIAGSNLMVGNWPGVTVDKKHAKVKFKDCVLDIVDLPGTYNINSGVETEERIAIDYISKGDFDIILNVVDSTNLERHLYLTCQLADLGKPIVMALNFYDEAKKLNINLDINKLEELLGVKAAFTVATSRRSLKVLLNHLISTLPKPKGFSYSNTISKAVSEFQNKYHSQYSKAISVWNSICELFSKNGKFSYAISCERYSRASSIYSDIYIKQESKEHRVTRIIDSIVLHKVFAFPVFLFVMFMFFKLTYDISDPYLGFLEGFVEGPLSRWTTAILNLISAPEWFKSLMLDGVVGGVGFVITFTPVVAVMMLFVTFLDNCGYMARAAYITDRLMRSVGMNGKSFIPIMMGLGCNVPAVYATKVLGNNSVRIITSLVLPFMSCSARLPVYILFGSAFFAGYVSLLVYLMYIGGLIIGLIIGAVAQKLLFPHDTSVFIMELPPYRLPTVRALFKNTMHKVRIFLRKAGTYIFCVSIIVWALSNVPFGVDTKDSALGRLGGFISPVFTPLGFGNWEAGASLITGVIAKEIVISTMGIIYNTENDDDSEEEQIDIIEDIKGVCYDFYDATLGAINNVTGSLGLVFFETEPDDENDGVRAEIAKKFTTASAASFLVFVLLYMPCVVTAIAQRAELGSSKWMLYSIGISTGMAWICAFITYRVALLIGV